MVSKRRIAAGAAVSILLVGLATLIAQWWFATSHPPDADWAEAAAFVKRHHKSGERIRVHPAWTESPLPALQSVGRAISPQHYPVREDFAGVSRIWVISDRGRMQEAWGRLPFNDMSDPLPEPDWRNDQVAVLSYETAPDELPKHSLFKWLKRANVEIRASKESTKCKNWDGDRWRWHCSASGARSYVGRDLRFFADDAHKCIRAYPPNGDRSLVITYPKLPAGEMLRIRAGLTTLTALANRGSSVTMKVTSDTLPTFERTFHKDRASWHAYDIALPEDSRPSLSIHVRAENTHKRYFCFNGWIYEPAVAEVGDGWRIRKHR